MATAAEPSTLIAHRGRVALVTGAARGLGRAIALALARSGADVAILDLPDSDARLQQVADEAERLEAGGQTLRLHADVSRPEACGDAVAAVEQRFGRLDILVNNAALGPQLATPTYLSNPIAFFELPPQLWVDAMRVNVDGPFLMARSAVPGMIRQGWGRVVNILTSQHMMVRAGLCPYGPSKAALESATSIWAKDLAGTGVTVNAVLPGGPADTRFATPEEAADRTPLLDPAIMGPPVLWLASEGSGAVTGARLIAMQWDTDLLPAAAAERCMSRAGWGLDG